MEVIRPCRRAQSTLEVVVLLVVVVSAVYVMGSYIHRASNGRIRELIESLGATPYDENAKEYINMEQHIYYTNWLELYATEGIPLPSGVDPDADVDVVTTIRHRKVSVPLDK